MRLLHPVNVAAHAIATAVLLAPLTVDALSQYGTSAVGFSARGPGGLQIRGKGSGVTVKKGGSNVVVEARVDSLKTGISLRDHHLKKAIHADRHPVASLTVPWDQLKVPADGGSTTADLNGRFRLNGVARPTAFHYEAKRQGTRVIVRGTATVDITQHGVERPCYLAVCVDRKVNVRAAFKVEL